MTETGDSITNQVNMCKDYAKFHFGVCEFMIYEDEGFSGGNMDRPMFKKLMADIGTEQIEVLMCYRLDRISRNVNDFSSTLERLNHHNVAFVSITEQFDTSTPLGKAMLSISSVFAELERDTIAQRITDNFTELAKTGRYLTGTPPEGFVKKTILHDNGKRYNVLEVVPDEAEKIQLLYEKYRAWESLTRVVMFCFENEIQTKSGASIKTDSVARILTHPLYAVADGYTYEYFRSLGATIVAPKELFDGVHGITVFRRTKKARGRHNDRSEAHEWIIGVGHHEGIIQSGDWIATQKLINSRKLLWARKATGATGILNGILKCSKCGDYMRPVCIRDGTFYYTCVTKEKSRQTLCTAKNLKHTADTAVVEAIAGLLGSRDQLTVRLQLAEHKPMRSDKTNELRRFALQKQLKETGNAIENLVMQLSKNQSEALIAHITAQVEALDGKTKALRSELSKLEEERQGGAQTHMDANATKKAIDRFAQFDFNDIEDVLIKRNIIKTMIQNVYWDGSEIRVIFF